MWELFVFGEVFMRDRGLDKVFFFGLEDLQNGKKCVFLQKF